ncbi:MAG TPA: YdbH domain-containing protein [Novosphingobium sp.]|nr:YdbH domain-containing protein [Novosphingobium sp.]
MAQDEDQAVDGDERPEPRERRRRRWRVAAIVLLGLLLVAGGAIWFTRKDIANNVIGGQLDSMGLPARYEIVRIGPSEQVIRGLSIGDPQQPDLTVEEIRVRTKLNWGLPGIGRITLVRPRLFGRLRGGRVSFGSLDKVLFTGGRKPFSMPDYDLKIVDGRALIESGYGRMGARLEGEGRLRGGFVGEFAAIAPRLAAAGCEAGRTSLYGKLSVTAQKPRFVGPLRLASLSCPEQRLQLARAGARLDLTFDKALDGGEGAIGLAAAEGVFGDSRAHGLAGKAQVRYRERAFNARYELAARGVATSQARIAGLAFDGRARSSAGLERIDIEGDLAGKGIAIGPALDRTLAEAVRAGEGTLIAPLAAQVRTALMRETRGSTLDANLVLRRSPEGLSLVIPRGSLRGGSGASLLALSRVQALIGGGAPRLTGNFATGGRGLPAIAGRMETGAGGRLSMRIEMPEYRAGETRVAIPELALVQGRNGALGFAGQARLSGALPGGRAEDLLLPVEGAWAANGDLAIWPRCVEVAFGRLVFANLTLDKRGLQVCPAAGAPIVRSRDGGMEIAAGVPRLDLAGHLGQTPIRIASGALGFARKGSRPGTISAKAVVVELGPRDTASKFGVTHLDARLGKEVGGTFNEADVALYAVPLDLHHTAGNWRYANGVFSIDKGSFTLVDRAPAARFEPVAARDATLRLANNVITAQALMREPASDREVVRAGIVHDLATARGHADLTVEGIAFDRKLQADTLSHMALGVVSNLEGTVRGTARIDWSQAGLTSHGRFATEGLGFAAAFGPVKGLSGEVVFTDLLGLVTAPDQRLKIASINPGIEVTDGVLSFQMKPNHVLQVNGARWPFMDGELTLEPATMTIGVAETRRYTLKVQGLDAATFVQHLDLTNINATGVFDGELPLVFDENGGRIENGYLTSRPPGGNVAYVGSLTYKDLSAMGNFAFDALKSVDYKNMEIGLGGSLSGEIITRISFDGLSQGAGAKSNFLTRQVAKLPIRFILNIRAPFFSLFGSMRSLYDPRFVTDPRTLGLIDKSGKPRPNAQPAAIQPPVSENNP